MKIGIITFHWATNYGAILQSYCLQEYLREQGHHIEIINYKPKQYDFSWIKLLSNPKKWLSIPQILLTIKKEKLLIPFREEYLNQTKRFYRECEMTNFSSRYDAIISGSDQILNSYFTLRGEGNSSTSAYFLGFASPNCKCLGYAVSFGCTEYAKQAINIATKWIQKFDCIGLREITGINIISKLQYNKYSQLVPDPTLLYGSKLFDDFNIHFTTQKKDYICVYMLRHVIRLGGKVKYIDETKKPLTMKEWLSTISSASALITNSYHGMIMAILSQVPFAVLLETGRSSGMNDRFLTLLSKLNLEDRIVYNIDDVYNVLRKRIDFNNVDQKISVFRQEGVDFIKKALL